MYVLQDKVDLVYTSCHDANWNIKEMVHLGGKELSFPILEKKQTKPKKKPQNSLGGSQGRFSRVMLPLMSKLNHFLQVFSEIIFTISLLQIECIRS